MEIVVRRVVSISGVLLILPLFLITAPLWVPLSVVVDLATGLNRLPTLRLIVFGAVYLVHEWIGLGAAVGLSLTGFLRRSDTPDRAARLEPYRRVQAWWAESLLRWAGRLLGVRFDLPDTATLPADRFLLLSRHASMADAVLPGVIMANRLGRFVHYILKAELQWDPSLDLFGQRLGNYFLSRKADRDAESRAIEHFAAEALPRSAIVIYPEGTYSTETTRRRVRASIARTGPPELLALADDLDHLLPPKPAGTLALLNAQPDSDVVIFGYVGLEGVARLGGLRRRLPLADPIVVRWWSHARAEIPLDPAARIEWLNEQWRALDAWVASVPRPHATP